MKNEKWDDVHGNTTPDDRMVAFLESPTDSYAILQLREDVDDNIPLMFANYSYLQKKESNIVKDIVRVSIDTYP